MRRMALVGALAVTTLGGLAVAQVAYPPAALDPTTVASKSDLASVQAMIPTPMLSAPPAEAVGGAGGSPGTYRTGTAVQPRITRTVPFTTTAAGTSSVSWTDMGAVPLVFVVPNVAAGATQAPVCSPVAGTTTSTGVTVRCWTTQSVTVSLLGAVVAPLTTAGAGVTGQVLAIPSS